MLRTGPNNSDPPQGWGSVCSEAVVSQPPGSCVPAERGPPTAHPVTLTPRGLNCHRASRAASGGPWVAGQLVSAGDTLGSRGPCLRLGWAGREGAGPCPPTVSAACLRDSHLAWPPEAQQADRPGPEHHHCPRPPSSAPSQQGPGAGAEEMGEGCRDAEAVPTGFAGCALSGPWGGQGRLRQLSRVLCPVQLRSCCPQPLSREARVTHFFPAKVGS